MRGYTLPTLYLYERPLWPLANTHANTDQSAAGKYLTHSQSNDVTDSEILT